MMYPVDKKPHKALDPLPYAARLANKTSDYVVFWFVTAIVLLPLVVLAFFMADMWLYIAILVGLVFVVMLMMRIMHVQLLSNSMRLQNSTHHHLSDDIDMLRHRLKMSAFDVFVVQDPYLNAFAFGYPTPQAIVLHSATLERLTYDEMRAILIHEIGHVYYHHTRLGVFYNAIITGVPVIGPIVAWFYGFWSRRAEYTADRLAVAVTGDPDLVIRALMKVHIGADVATFTSKEYLLYQDAITSMGWRRFTQTFSTHPYLVNRIKAILRFADAQGYDMAEDVRLYIRYRSHG